MSLINCSLLRVRN